MVYQITGGQDELPDSPSFLVPLCTNRERFQLIVDALNYAAQNDPENGLKYTVDFLQAWQYLRDPENSPCVQSIVQNPPQTGDCNCLAYPPYTEEIEWNPQNPFTEPDKKPGGYKKPVWKLHNNDDSLGRRAGDVYIDQTSVIFFDSGLPLPTPGELEDFANFIAKLPTTGFPRFRVNVQGTGVLELHLMQAPLAGLALITVDGGINGYDIINMGTIGIDDFESILDGLESLDDLLLGALESILPGLLGTIDDGNIAGIFQPYIKEIEFRTEGNHYVEVTFLPNFSTAPPFILGFGGGLRKIVQCGFDPIVKPRKPVIRQNPDEEDTLEWWDGTRWVFLQKLVPYPVAAADCGCEEESDCDDCDCEDCEESFDDCGCEDSPLPSLVACRKAYLTIDSFYTEYMFLIDKAVASDTFEEFVADSGLANRADLLNKLELLYGAKSTNPPTINNYYNYLSNAETRHQHVCALRELFTNQPSITSQEYAAVANYIDGLGVSTFGGSILLVGMALLPLAFADDYARDFAEKESIPCPCN